MFQHSLFHGNMFDLPKGEKFLRGLIFASHFFFNILLGFNFVNWLPLDFLGGFIFANLTFISIFIYFDFIVVCSSASSK